MRRNFYKACIVLAVCWNLLDAFSGLVMAQQEAGQTAGPCNEPLTSIFKRVSPSVVFITALSINPYRPNDRVEHVVGSGFIIDSSGLVLTNSHVVFGRQVIVITLDDGTTVPAQLAGADPIFDVALLKIPKPTEGVLSVTALGDSDRLQVGEEVVAIGNPLGLDQSLTRGVVSAIDRILPETSFSFEEPLIQMDTPVNPGNSGGPLVNRCGEVVGITTSVIPGAQNIGFSIPVNMAKELVPRLLKDGRVIRPWLGFHGQFIENGLKQVFSFPLVQGFLIEVVEPASPADKGGLHGGGLELSVAGRDFLIGGDIITQMNGKPITSPETLADTLKTLSVGSILTMKVFREGKYLEVKYGLPERPLLPGDIPGEQMVLPMNHETVGKVRMSH
jgi:S1-C subfamily serine protease